jgi:predicted Zn finger-like uncharacterized protein
MRLTCPACGAVYDVPDDAIPVTGREVECSDCGAVWLARKPAGTEAERPADNRFAIERALAFAVTAEKAAPEAQIPRNSTPDDLASDEDEDDETSPTSPAAAPKRRPLDDSILRILREEAERETRARAAERTPVEIQPDLGLTVAQPGPPSPIVPPPPQPEAKPRTPAPRSAPAPDSPAPSRDRFGTGFLLAIGLSAAALYTYVAAPGIATEFPGLAPVLTHYVSFVDSLRLWLSEAADALREMAPG